MGESVQVFVGFAVERAPQATMIMMISRSRIRSIGAAGIPVGLPALAPIGLAGLNK